MFFAILMLLLISQNGMSAPGTILNNNNLIIIQHNVYGAVLVTMVTVRVHPVHLMNAD